MKKLTSLLLVVCLIIASFLILPVAGDGEDQKELLFFDRGNIRSTTHNPIKIVGDSEFTIANGVSRGSGNSSNPYIIENWDINGTGMGYCIYIANTTKYFILRNCSLHNSNGGPGNAYSTYYNDGIAIYNASYGLIQNNTLFANNWTDISLRNSNNITILKNICSSNGIERGIYIYKSVYNVIQENIIDSTASRGIMIYWASSHNMIKNNICVNHTGYGIQVMGNCNYCTLVNNTCINNRDGIDFEGDYQVVKNNICRFNREGILGHNIKYSDIENNDCSFNLVNGIRIAGIRVNISNNTCNSNKRCGIWINFDPITIFNNTCSKNRNGIEILSSNCVIKQNILQENVNCGIELNYDGSTSSGNLLYLNNFINNNIQAIDNETGNKWNNLSHGNFWGYWRSPDTNDDGIVDNPYNISGSARTKDKFPLVDPTYPFESNLIILYRNKRISYVGQLYRNPYSAYDPDTPEKDLIWTMRTNASWLNFSTDQVLSGTPSSLDIGKYWVNISVSDGSNSDSTNFTISVLKELKGTVIIERTGQKFIKIQDAIDNAIPGDTIRVWSGVYYENVVVNKTLSIIGNGSENTLIDCGLNGAVMDIVANYCNITGFSIKNSSYPYTGIYISSSYNLIKDCDCSENDFGIYITEGKKNKIINCKSGSNTGGTGIVIQRSEHNLIRNCNCSNIFLGAGIIISKANWNTIENTVCNSNEGDYYDYLGSKIYYSNHTIIKNYTGNGNSGPGLWIEGSNDFYIENCTLNKSIWSCGLYLNDSQNGLINTSRFKENNGGINISFSKDIEIIGCEFLKNNEGIFIDHSSSGWITECLFNDNTGQAIHLDGGYSSNRNFNIYNNIFLNNNGATSSYISTNIQAIDNTQVGKNNWNSSAGIGNYWSDWTTPDKNNDGIVDLPYNISGSAGAKDHYPLTKQPFSFKFPPVINTKNDLTAQVGELYSVNYSAFDPDTPKNQLTWAMRTNVTWLSFSTTKELSGTPAESDVGTYWVFISVSDGENMDSTNFTLTVMKRSKPQPPPVDNGTVILIRTGQKFTRIQDAIENASTGDTIHVWAGVYNEHIEIYKSLTLIGNGSDVTIIKGRKIGNTTDVLADNCNITGFSIFASGTKYWSAGISLYGVKDCKISECNFSRNKNGIRIVDSNNNLVFKNAFYINSNHGVWINSSNYNYRSNNNVIKNNVFIKNWNYAISIDNYCTSNQVYHNNLIGNMWVVNCTCPQAGDDGLNNNWNSSSEGNYWSDWMTPDNNSDGIVDLPYKIDGGVGAKDHYPLVKPFNITGKPALPTGRVIIVRTGQKFNNIQDAIDNASYNDTIEVYNGSYYENIIVNKSIKIISKYGYNHTIIESIKPYSHVIEITSDKVSIIGFGIKTRTKFNNRTRVWGELSSGIIIRSSNYCNISNNNIINFEIGISLYPNDPNENENIRETSNFNIISSNRIYTKDGTGIRIVGFTPSVLPQKNGDCPIRNIIEDNYIFGDNKIGNFSVGIKLSGDNNIIRNNFIEKCERGIQLSGSNKNNIIKNKIIFNDEGLRMTASSNNTFTHNHFQNNDVSIDLRSTDDNILFFNNFIDNQLNIYYEDEGGGNISYGDNIWRTFSNLDYWNTSEKLHYKYNDRKYYNYLGNYWSDWSSPDNDSDGIVDLPYNIPGNSGAKDYYPLTKKVDINFNPLKNLSQITINTNIPNHKKDISINTSEIIITFSQPMNTSLVEANLKISPYINYTLVWEKNNTVLLIIFQEPLKYDTTYKITIDNLNLDLDLPFELVFTTEPEQKINGHEPENGDPIQILAYLGIVVVIIIILIILLFAFITRKRKLASEHSTQKPGPPDERQELPASNLAEEIYTESDLPNGSEEFILDLKDKALTLKKPSQFGPTREKRLKIAQDKYEKDEISKDTYESILEIIDKKS